MGPGGGVAVTRTKAVGIEAEITGRGVDWLWGRETKSGELAAGSGHR